MSSNVDNRTNKNHCNYSHKNLNMHYHIFQSRTLYMLLSMFADKKFYTIQYSSNYNCFDNLPYRYLYNCFYMRQNIFPCSHPYMYLDNPYKFVYNHLCNLVYYIL